MKIKGLEEYGSVRDAYDEIEIHLKRVAELKEIIGSHKAGTEFLKAEEGRAFDSRMEEADNALAEANKSRFRKSGYIIDSIESRIGKRRRII